MRELRLKAEGFTRSATGMSWRWALTMPGGRFLGDHKVGIDNSAWQYEAFTDLYGWLKRQTSPGQGWLASQEDAVAAMGDWLTERVFGGLAEILVYNAPCAVRVTLSQAAADLAFMPLELARVRGRTLAPRHVSLVIDLPPLPVPGGLPPEPAAQAADELRLLGLFSLPERSSPLNLRQERYELQRLAGELSGSGHSIKLRMLQYGATRERLAEAVEDGDGWDVVHLSGHGRAGAFVLETPDGGRDPIAWEDLVDLLTPLRHRVKLVTVSSCESGERISRQQLELLLGGDPSAGTGVGGAGAGAGPRALASELARQLECAVVGMRYPVTDPFAAAFGGELYRLMFDQGQPLARARAGATANTVPKHATLDRPALCAGAAALYGASAIDLRLVPPRVDKSAAFTHEITKLAGFPDQDPRFVGRGTVMSRVAQALAPRSGRAAVVLHGPEGVGKTALAVELAYTQRDSFPDLVWYPAPEDDAAVPAAVGELSTALEQKIDDLDLTSLLDDEEKIRAFRPRLTEFFANRRILLVIDHADSLLSPTDTWRDERMGVLLEAMISHTGLGRVVVTTRRPIAGLSGDPVLTEPMSPLSPVEMILLARELPRLRGLLDGVAPPFNEPSARGLARQILKVARGYPGLLERADKRAEHPLELARLALAAEQSWPAGYRAVLAALTPHQVG